MAWQTVLKAIGGAMSGVANGMQNQINRPAPGENHQQNNLDDNTAQREMQSAIEAGMSPSGKDSSGKGMLDSEKFTAGGNGQGSSSGYSGAKNSGEFAGTDVGAQIGAKQGTAQDGGDKGSGFNWGAFAGGLGKGFSAAANFMSDETAKNYFAEHGVVDDYEKICAYLFKYRPEVQERYGGTLGIDDDVHVGVMAQELAALPATQSAVHRDANSGYLVVDTQDLTMSNTAAIAELSRRVAEMEKMLGKRSD